MSTKLGGGNEDTGLVPIPSGYEDVVDVFWQHARNLCERRAFNTGEGLLLVNPMKKTEYRIMVPRWALAAYSVVLTRYGEEAHEIMASALNTQVGQDAVHTAVAAMTKSSLNRVSDEEVKPIAEAIYRLVKGEK